MEDIKKNMIVLRMKKRSFCSALTDEEFAVINVIVMLAKKKDMGNTKR